MLLVFLITFKVWIFFDFERSRCNYILIYDKRSIFELKLKLK
jgi:hypothetical protein